MLRDGDEVYASRTPSHPHMIMHPITLVGLSLPWWRTKIKVGLGTCRRVVPCWLGSDTVDASGPAHSEPGRTSYEVAQQTGGVDCVSYRSSQREAFAYILVRQAVSLLQRTRLHVSVSCQVWHAKNARYMLFDIIDHNKPTMLIVGSRGMSQLKGYVLNLFLINVTIS